MVRGSQVALRHVIHDMEARTLVMEWLRHSIKRWVHCGDMDRRLKIPHSAKVECGFWTTPVIPPIYLNGEQISVVEHDKHLGKFLSTDIYDRNIITNVCDLYQRSNLLISDFRVCDCITLDSLFNTYCMHMYRCELWDLSCKYIDGFKVAWRKIKRRVWRLPAQAHNTIVHNLTCNVDYQFENRMLKFTHMCLNHHNTKYEIRNSLFRH